MSNITTYMIYGGAAFFGILILVVGYFTYTAVKERQRLSNLELPNLEEMDKEKRLEKMRESREEFGFGNELNLSETQIAEISDEESEVGQYIDTTRETSVHEDFGGILTSSGTIARPAPILIKNEIDLPDILDDVSLQSKPESETNDVNVHNTPTPSDTASNAVIGGDDFSLPNID